MVAVETTTSRDVRYGSDRAVALWLFVIAGMIALMVLVGGLTRLTGSGLSITEWRPVTGAIPPLSDADWQAEFARYQGTPQYDLLNRGMGIAAFKTIYWWEWTHRLLGRLIGVVFAVPFLVFLWQRRIDRALAGRLAIIFLLGGAQGALGWWMVQSGSCRDARGREPVPARRASGTRDHPVRLHPVDGARGHRRATQRCECGRAVPAAGADVRCVRVRPDAAGRVRRRSRCGARVFDMADLRRRMDSPWALRSRAVVDQSFREPRAGAFPASHARLCGRADGGVALSVASTHRRQAAQGSRASTLSRSSRSRSRWACSPWSAVSRCRSRRCIRSWRSDFSPARSGGRMF